MRAARRTDRGFTLIEVLVALTILAMSILFITRAFLTLLEVTNEGGNVTVASALAVRKLEQVRGSPESQSSSTGWTANFDAIVDEGPTAFPAPYSRYSYQVIVNQVTLTPGSAAPAWLTGAPMHSNTIKWITVRVTFQGQTLAQVTSSVIREMYRRP
ncbi:MAG: prepilin-type N-terminal cleavage/methylation domain-containing protein [Armatimonadetes bacterium]|nr:prepilin-type N-terminal cleavage/methylation domain-containing protein [Armatimonadota bacterium]